MGRRMTKVGMALIGVLVVLCFGPVVADASPSPKYHNEDGTRVEPRYMSPVTGRGWDDVLAPLNGQGWSWEAMEKQVMDYLSPSKTPLGVNYPSIKAVPMFNEMWVEGIKLNTPTLQEVDGTNTYAYSAEVTVGFETWFPFPSDENEGGTYWIYAPTMTMQSSEASTGIWIPVALQLSSGEIQEVEQASYVPDRKSVEVHAVFGDGKPTIHEFKYDVQFRTAVPVTDPNVALVLQAGWEVMTAINLYGSSASAVDRLPPGVKASVPPQVFTQGEASGRMAVEVTDPRLNHLVAQWQQAESEEGTPGEINDATKKIAAFQQAGPWMYCRNGKMESLAEFGCFSVGKPWQTLDLQADAGRRFLALGVLEKSGEDSDYLQEAMRVRDLMRTALTAAQNDYSEALWSARMSLPDKNWEVFTSEASGIESISGKQGTLGGSGVIITNGEVLEWLPARYKTRNVLEEMEDAEWILVRENPGKESRILGRYAYICLDSSGGLDANWVAREVEVANRDTSRSLTNRPHHSIREVPMGLLPEVLDASCFKYYRNGWKGFDTLPTLVKLTDGVPNDGSGNLSNTRWQPERREYVGSVGLASNLVSDLVPYSLTAYRGGRYHRGTGVWDKPSYMDPGTGAGWQAVLAPLQGQGWSASDLEKQLRDYLSSSRAPQGVDYPSIKAVPMFNEMWVKGIKLNSPTYVNWMDTYVYTAEVTVGFETWFPFPSEDNKGGTYRIDAPRLTMQSSVGCGIWIPVALQLSSGAIQQVTQEYCIPDKEYVAFEATYGKPKKTAEFTYKVTFQTANAVRDANASLMWRMGWTAEDAIDLKDSSGTTVDRLAKGVKFQAMTHVFRQGESGGAFSMEVTDPRLNHLAAQWQMADTDEGTPGEINSVTKGLPDFLQEGPWMYCRNGKMASLAEFGYFSTGKPWKTIDLCTREGAEFLALGTLDKGLKDDLASKGVHYTNSTININTHRTNVLASAFYDLSFMPTPNTDDSKIEKENAFTEEQARRLAHLIQQETACEPYQSGQDWANTPAMRDGGYLQSQGLTRTERESVLRNTDGLFSVSDSLFTVVVVAQSVKEGDDPSKLGQWDEGDQITGERRGVALVWRDPFKIGNSTNNEMMVRSFRSLDVEER